MKGRGKRRIHYGQGKKKGGGIFVEGKKGEYGVEVKEYREKKKWKTLEKGWGIVRETGTMTDERNRMLETVHCTLTGTVRVHMWSLL